MRKAPDAPLDRPADKEAPRFTNAQLARAGAAVGIGSAALVAALLYARNRKKPVVKPRARERFTD